MKDLSIVIVNWNTEKLLLESIESINKETKKYSFEIIVVDNASSDNSTTSLKKYHKKVTLIENTQNLGFAKANNQGIKASNGRYVCLVNTDTVALDHVLDKMTEYMDRHENIGALLCEHLDKDLKKAIMLREFPNLRNILCEAFYLNKLFKKIKIFRGRELPLSMYNEIRKVDTVPCNYILIRNEALKDVGLLDERFFIYAEDIDISKRLNDANWPIYYYPHAKIIHYGGSSSKVAPGKFLVERIIAELQYWKKHHGIFKQFIYRTILFFHYKLRVTGYILLYPFKIKKRNRIKQTIKSYGASAWFLLTGKGPRISNN